MDLSNFNIQAMILWIVELMSKLEKRTEESNCLVFMANYSFNYWYLSLMEYLPLLQFIHSVDFQETHWIIELFQLEPFFMED